MNNELKDYHYPLPSPEEIFAKLSGGKFFSKIDLSDANLQIPVHEECLKPLCINTHRVCTSLNDYHSGSRLRSLSSNKSWTPCLVYWNLRLYTWMTFSWIIKVPSKIKMRVRSLQENPGLWIQVKRRKVQITDKDGRRPDPASAIKTC